MEKISEMGDTFDDYKKQITALRRRVAELERALKDAKGAIYNHHEYGHIIRAYEKAFTENCDVCESSSILETINTLLKGN